MVAHAHHHRHGMSPQIRDDVRFIGMWVLAVLFMVAVEVAGLMFVDAVLR